MSCVMDEQTKAGRVLQMRLVVEAADYERAVAFYRDVLGVPEELVVEGEKGEKVTILDVGRATLEISNPAQVAMIDDVEVGRLVSPSTACCVRGRRCRERDQGPRRRRRGVDCGADRDALGLAQLAAVGTSGLADHVVRGVGQRCMTEPPIEASASVGTASHGARASRRTVRSCVTGSRRV